MKFTMTVELDNDAFVGTAGVVELVSVIQRVERKVVNRCDTLVPMSDVLMDFNGNRIGEWSIV